MIGNDMNEISTNRSASENGKYNTILKRLFLLYKYKIKTANPLIENKLKCLQLRIVGKNKMDNLKTEHHAGNT